MVCRPPQLHRHPLGYYCGSGGPFAACSASATAQTAWTVNKTCSTNTLGCLRPLGTSCQHELSCLSQDRQLHCPCLPPTLHQASAASLDDPSRQLSSAHAWLSAHELLLTCRACNQAGHAACECPRKYYAVLGEACPGFDASGKTIPSAWQHGDLTDATKASWVRYIQQHNLLRSKHVFADVQFF